MLANGFSIANIYIFLLAGHEVRNPYYFPYTFDCRMVMQTTANTLCFAFALLALYPDEQEKLFEHIKSVTKGRLPARSIFFLSGFRGKFHSELCRPMRTCLI